MSICMCAGITFMLTYRNRTELHRLVLVQAGGGTHVSIVIRFFFSLVCMVPLPTNQSGRVRRSRRRIMIKGGGYT